VGRLLTCRIETADPSLRWPVPRFFFVRDDTAARSGTALGRSANEPCVETRFPLTSCGSGLFGTHDVNSRNGGGARIQVCMSDERIDSMVLLAT